MPISNVFIENGYQLNTHFKYPHSKCSHPNTNFHSLPFQMVKVYLSIPNINVQNGQNKQGHSTYINRKFHVYYAIKWDVPSE